MKDVLSGYLCLWSASLFLGIYWPCSTSIPKLAQAHINGRVELASLVQIFQESKWWLSYTWGGFNIECFCETLWAVVLNKFA